MYEELNLKTKKAVRQYHKHVLQYKTIKARKDCDEKNNPLRQIRYPPRNG